MRAAAWILLVAASLLVFLKGARRDVPSPEAAGGPAGEWAVREVEGERLLEEPLGDREKAFARDFPGRIGRFRAGRKVVILRETTRATHRVHSASTCLAASGWTVDALPVERRESGDWSCFRAKKGGETLVVREQIRAADGATIPDVPSWFWAALTGRTHGPWLVMTIVEK